MKQTVGDLIFFRNKSGNINHVGLYVGDNKLLHASSSKGVIVQPLNDPYLANGFAGIRRFLPDNAIN
jgi:cell wall-associated NlpC family hydrolase